VEDGGGPQDFESILSEFRDNLGAGGLSLEFDDGWCDFQTQEAAAGVICALRHPSFMLRGLDLHLCAFDNTRICALASALRCGTCPLERLCLSQCPFGDAGLKALVAAAGDEACALNSLSLAWQGTPEVDSRNEEDSVTFFGWRVLAKAMRDGKLHRMRHLDLSVNRLENVLPYIAEALSSGACPLETLDLNFATMKSAGIKDVIYSLMSDECVLVKLDVRQDMRLQNDNDFVGLAVNALLARSPRNFRLRELVVTGSGYVHPPPEQKPELVRTLKGRRRCIYAGLFRCIPMLLLWRKRATERFFHPDNRRARGEFEADMAQPDGTAWEQGSRGSGGAPAEQAPVEQIAMRPCQRRNLGD
jgi:hypothetical protein